MAGLDRLREGMRKTRATAKAALWACGAFVLYYAGMFKLINRWIAGYQWKPQGQKFGTIRRRRGNTLQILTFHRVGRGPDPYLPAMPTGVFERQMEYVARNFEVCPLAEAVELLRNDALPPNAIALTFDDGYKDNSLHAFPVLRALGLPATVFLVAGVIGNGRILWHDRVFRAFHETTRPVLREFGPERGTYPLTGNQAVATRDRVLRFLKHQSEGDRERWIGALMDRLGLEDQKHAPGLMLDWDDAREMQRHGVTFGSHTVTHPVLSRVSEERAWDEIARSKGAIEEQLGCPVTTFAYPNGKKADFNSTTKRLLSRAGITIAVSTLFGCNSGLDLDPLELRRQEVGAERPPAFAAKLSYYRFVS